MGLLDSICQHHIILCLWPVRPIWSALVHRSFTWTFIPTELYLCGRFGWSRIMLIWGVMRCLCSLIESHQCLYGKSWWNFRQKTYSICSTFWLVIFVQMIFRSFWFDIWCIQTSPLAIRSALRFGLTFIWFRITHSDKLFLRWGKITDGLDLTWAYILNPQLPG